MHLIPLAHVSPANAREQYRRRTAGLRGKEDEEDDLDDFISAQDAIKLLRDPLEDNSVSVTVEGAVWQRISKCARENLCLKY
jgi:hypothetical protein